MVQKLWFGAKGPEATQLRRKKYSLVRQFGFPEDALPGVITRTHRRCGKPTCHCAGTEGHPMWVLSFSVGGHKHTETIPEEWVPQLAELVERGNELREGLAELLRINAQLLRLWREQQRAKRSRSSKSKLKRTGKKRRK